MYRQHHAKSHQCQARNQQYEAGNKMRRHIRLGLKQKYSAGEREWPLYAPKG